MNIDKLMRQYKGVQVDSAVDEASSHKLVSLLMNGALDRLLSAKASQEPSSRKALVGKTISIIEYLRVSLDPGADLKFSEQLGELYRYMESKLLESTLNDDAAQIDQVIDLIKPIRDGWDSIEQEYRG